MSGKDDKLCTEIRKNLERAIKAEQDNRKAASEDTKFENGEQWIDLDRIQRESDGRPTLVMNRVAGTVKQIIGDARQNKISCKVRPVDSEADPATAEIFTGMIRNIENVSRAEYVYDYVFSCTVRGGYGCFRLLTDYADDNVFDQDIYIERIVNPDSVYFDTNAIKQDYSDANWVIVTEDLSHEEFKKQYPGKSLDSNLLRGQGDDEHNWITDETVRIAEYFVVEKKKGMLYMLENGKTINGDEIDIIDYAGVKGIYDGESFLQIVKERETDKRKIKWYKTNGFEILEGPNEWPGRYLPIFKCIGEEIWLDGKKHLRSAIKWAKEPARVYNWSWSTQIETMSMGPKQPFLVTPEEIKGHESQWNFAHKKLYPYLLHNQSPLGRPQRQVGSAIDAGAVQTSMMAADDIKASTGIFDASLGAKGNETSGKAILARQREGDTATFTFHDNLVMAVTAMYRALVDLIPRIYDTQRVVRLLGVDGAEGFQEINQVVIDPETFEMVVLNDLSIGKYDVVVSAGAQYNTKRVEAAEGMIQLIQAAPQYLQIIAPKLLKNLDWPGSDEIAEEIMALNEQASQEGGQEQSEVIKEALNIESKQLDIAKKEQDIIKQATQDEQSVVETAQKATVAVLQQLGII